MRESGRPSQRLSWLAAVAGIFAVCIVVAVDVRAQDTDAPDSDSSSDGQDYSSTTVGSRISENLLHDGHSIAVVDEDEMRERPAATIADLLDEVVGVHAQSTNRGAGAPILRGQIGPSNLLVFDGIRINNGTFPTGPNQYLNTFDAFSLAQIEVMRGPGGVIYGSDAIGGVIHLVPEGLRYGHGMGGGGFVRFQSVDLSVTAAPYATWSNNQFGVRLGGTFSRFGDPNNGSDGDSDGDSANNDSVVLGSSYTQFGGHARLGFLPSPALELRLSYFGNFLRDAGRIDRLYDSNFRLYDNDNHLIYAHLSHFGDGAFAEVTATISVNLTNEVVDRHDCTTGDVLGVTDASGLPVETDTTVDPSGCVEQRLDAITRVRENADDVTTLGTSLVVLSHLPLEGLSLIWGSDAYFSTVGSSRVDSDPTADGLVPRAPVRGNFSDGASYLTLGGFVEAQYQVPLMGGIFVLRPEAGARVSHVRAAAGEVPDLGDVTYDFTGVTGNARLSLVLQGHGVVFFGFTQGFRAPNLQETTTLGDTGSTFEIPNDGLGPERSNEFELGTRLAFDPLIVEVAAFHTQVSDIIVREDATFEGQSQVDGSDVVRRVNADEGVFYGVEFGLDVGLGGSLTLDANLTYIDGEVTNVGATQPPQRLPPFRYHAALRYALGFLDAFIEASANGALTQDALNESDLGDRRICGHPDYPGVLYSEVSETCPGTDRWVSLNLRAGLSPTENVTVNLAFDNLLNQRYRLHGSGLDAPGFNASVSVDVDY